MRVFEVEDVVLLLRSEIKRVGGVGVWAKKNGIHRTAVSKALSNARPPTKNILKALKLRTVFVPDSK
ncbi:MAG: hypothetical protein WA652_20035 [Xanthobacteraceae bacterium]